MGVVAAVVAGGLLGMGAASYVSKKQADAASQAAANAYQPPAAPETPEAPVADAAAGGTANAQMEQERERERQAALLRKQQAPELYTSGLGATGSAATAKKTLLGG